MELQTSSERRRLHRFREALPTLLMFEEASDARATRQLMAYTTDVSASGAFFVTEEAVTAGGDVTVYCLLPPEKEDDSAAPANFSMFYSRGTVVRRDPDGIAVRFAPQYKIVPVGASPSQN